MDIEDKRLSAQKSLDGWGEESPALSIERYPLDIGCGNRLREGEGALNEMTTGLMLYTANNTMKHP